ncbi:MAG: epoxyqueuosine reductase QueH [Clostridia bacterium]|nr:epoxyqueuosine reductase QueH [Clostridia bacterium]
MENHFERAFNIMENEGRGKTLLLHSCCAPCSSACLELLHQYFQVTVLYYNPNIEDEAEYSKRKAEQIRLLEQTGWANFLDCDHDAAAFQAVSKGLESCPERGERCYKCYALRLEKTAQLAKQKRFDYFTTTLSISPYKVARWINEIGYALQSKTGVRFLPSDFKKRNGYLRSIELSKEYGLYRQDFCGCQFSKKEREEQIKK